MLRKWFKYCQTAPSLYDLLRHNTMLMVCRWGQTYILEALMSYVPQESTEALLLAERISPRLSHSNSAVVLTCIRVILYLMNYIADQKQISALCRKLSPPLVTLLA